MASLDMNSLLPLSVKSLLSNDYRLSIGSTPVSVRYSFTHNKIFDCRNPCSPRKSEGVCFTGVGLCVSVCVCLWPE